MLLNTLDNAQTLCIADMTFEHNPNCLVITDSAPELQFCRCLLKRLRQLNQNHNLSHSCSSWNNINIKNNNLNKTISTNLFAD